MDEKIGSVRQLIDDSAARQSDKTFLVGPETGAAMTFSDLKTEANRIARRLLMLGLSKGDKIGLLMENGLAAAKLTLGAMYGGFVPVPLNAGAGPVQLQFALRHSDASVVFFSEDYTDLIRNVTAKIDREIRPLVTDQNYAPQSQGEAGQFPLPHIQDSDEALLIYTSGSTSEPKGVVLSHGNMLANAGSTTDAHQLTTDDRLFCVLPLYHMNAQVTLLATLRCGGCVVLPGKFSVNSFWNGVSTYGCTWSSLVPTIIAHLLNWTDPRGDGKADGLKQVRFMRCSSAPLPPPGATPRL
jgi:acyl-CoA synthetase (AMP-forming)/AMP-acid ligase II